MNQIEAGKNGSMDIHLEKVVQAIKMLVCFTIYFTFGTYNRNSNTVFYTVPGDKLGGRHSGHRTSK